MNPLVHDHHGRIEYGSGQRAKHAPHLRKLRQTVLGHSRHEHHSDKGRTRADEFNGRQLLTKEERRSQHNKDGRQIIAERRCGDRRIPVGFKEEDPVDAEDSTGNEESRKRLSDPLQIDPVSPETGDHEQKSHAEKAARHSDHAARQCDPSDEYPDRTREHNRENIPEAGFFCLLHILLPPERLLFSPISIILRIVD